MLRISVKVGHIHQQDVRGILHLLGPSKRRKPEHRARDWWRGDIAAMDNDVHGIWLDVCLAVGCSFLCLAASIRRHRYWELKGESHKAPSPTQSYSTGRSFCVFTECTQWMCDCINGQELICPESFSPEPINERKFLHDKSVRTILINGWGRTHRLLAASSMEQQVLRSR